MSRSKKKNPYFWLSNERAMKEWKTQCNRSLRRTPVDKELPKGTSYKKLNSIWTSPSDGKFLWDEPKGYRK